MSYQSGEDPLPGDRVVRSGSSGDYFCDAGVGLCRHVLQYGEQALVLSTDVGGIRLAMVRTGRWDGPYSPHDEFTGMAPENWQLRTRAANLGIAPPAPSVAGVCVCDIQWLMAAGCRCGATTRYVPPKKMF